MKSLLVLALLVITCAPTGANAESAANVKISTMDMDKNGMIVFQISPNTATGGGNWIYINKPSVSMTENNVCMYMFVLMHYEKKATVSIAFHDDNGIFVLDQIASNIDGF